MLSRDDDGVDANGDNSTTIMLVLDSDLSFGVGTEPGERAVTTGGRHGSIELVGEHEGQGEELRSLIGSITEHDTLITSAELLESLLIVETLSDIG